MIDLTIIYYTSNWLDEHNPYFLENTKKQLLKAADGLPIVIVSQKPMGNWLSKWDVLQYKKGDPVTVLNMGNIGRSHLNIYRQILEGCKLAKTKYVAMAEDDILYSESHFHSGQIAKEFESHGDVMLYDMNKVSLFTWTDPPMFSFRSKRKVVNQLIAPREMLVKALEERFARLEELYKQGWTEEKAIKFWGDLGRYEEILGVTPQPTVEFYSQVPSIVFSHPEAFGYLNQGKKKRLGDIRIIELYDWGTASDILALYK
jgi:hypothetical protein